MEFIMFIFSEMLLGAICCMYFSDIFEYKIGISRKNDIEEVLPVSQKITKLYMIYYIKQCGWYFGILLFLYEINLLLILASIVVFLFSVIHLCPNFFDNEQAQFYYLCFMLFVMFPGFLNNITNHKQSMSNENTQAPQTFSMDVQKFEEAKRVWNSLTERTGYRFRKKIWMQLKIRAIALQTTVLDYCASPNKSAEEREKAVKYAWDCLLEVQNWSLCTGEHQDICSKSTVFMNTTHFIQEFETAYNKYLSASSKSKQHYLESMIYTVNGLKREVETIHENNVRIHRDDTHEFHKNRAVLFRMIQKLKDLCDSHKLHNEDVYNLYTSMNNN